jgi:antitoxin VapB
MTTAKLFKNGRSQAVRLPKECRMGGSEVGVAKFGDCLILYPPGQGWKVLEESLARFTDDFMATRDQGPQQRRRKL